MQKILAPVRNFGVKVSHATGMLFPLLFGDSFLRSPIPARRFDLGTIRTGRQRFQAQINPDVFLPGADCLGRFAHKIDVPATPRILGEIAGFNGAGQWAAVPKAESVTGITHGIRNHLDARCLERNPAQRLFAAPAQGSFMELLMAGGVLLADRLHRLRMQAQVFAAAGGQLAQILIGRPALIPTQSVLLRFVAEIPDEINRTRPLIQRGGRLRIFDSIAERPYHRPILSIGL